MTLAHWAVIGHAPMRCLRGATHSAEPGSAERAGGEGRRRSDFIINVLLYAHVYAAVIPEDNECIVLLE